MTTIKEPTTTAPLPEMERAQLSERVASRGELATMRELGLSRIAVARALAGLPLHKGTRAVISAGLLAPVAATG